MTGSCRSDEGWLSYRFLLRFDLWLVIVTAVDFVLFINTDAITSLGGYPRGTVGGDLLGLLVPIGPYDLLYALFIMATAVAGSPLAVIGLARLGLAVTLVALCMFFGEYILRRLRVSFIQKIVINTFMLVSLTGIVELLMFGKWMSFLIVLYSIGLVPSYP
jgi:hypothetical protein